MIKNLIFDFDGVIADTFDVNWALSQEHDETATMEDFLAHHDGNVFAEPRIKFDPARVHLFYAEYFKRLHPSHIENSKDSLRRLGKLYNLFIISSNSEAAIVNVLERAGVAGLFTRIMGEETHKSKIEKFKMLMDQYDIATTNTVFVTDTLGDIHEAHKVGIRIIAETFGFHNRERLSLGKPFKIVDSWKEIEETVRDMDN